MNKAALEERFGTTEGLNGKDPQTILLSAVSHEEAEVQGRGRPQPVCLDYTPSLIPSPVLLPHLILLSVHLAGCGEGEARSRRSHRLQSGIRLSASLVWVQKTTPGTTPHWEQCEEELSTLLTSTLHSGPAHFVQFAPDGGSLKVGLFVARSSQRPRFSQSPQWILPALLKHSGSLPSHLRVKSKGLSLNA